MERPLITVDAASRYPSLLSMFDEELNSCKVIYNKQLKAAKEMGQVQNNIIEVVLYVFTSGYEMNFPENIYVLRQFIFVGKMTLYILLKVS